MIVLSGDILISGSADNSVRIWDLRSCECQHTLEGHTDSVNEVTLNVSIILCLV